LLVAARYSIRPMTMADIRQVMDIERSSFPASWPQTAYERELTRNRLAHYFVAVSGDGTPPSSARPNSVGVARLLPRRRAEITGDRIAGFVGVWRMVDEGHIVTIAVRSELRRQGLGDLLVDRAFGVAEEYRLPVLTLEVRASNEGAQRLYRRWGFRKVGVRKRYYSDNKEDAVIMTTDPLDSPAMRSALDACRARLRGRGLVAGA
jgi:[ribosomal protein S18]-alanine N-acetyltransferase